MPGRAALAACSACARSSSPRTSVRRSSRRCGSASAPRQRTTTPASAASVSPTPSSPRAATSSRSCRPRRPARRPVGGSRGTAATAATCSWSTGRRRSRRPTASRHSPCARCTAASYPDIVDVHLHPRDTGGVLLALDAVDPPGSWRWAGPAWTGEQPDVLRWAARGDRRGPRSGRGRPPLGGGAGRPAGRRRMPAPARRRSPGPLLRRRRGRRRRRHRGASGVAGGARRTTDLGGVRFEIVPLEEET